MTDNKDKVLPEVWVTKYALTNGVIECRSADVIEVKGKVAVTTFGMLFHPDWHNTEAAAIAHAKQMRDKKIASLKKQIEKLEKLTF